MSTEQPASGDAAALADDDIVELKALGRRFFDAVRDGDHRGLWALFSETAQAYVLNLAVERGMDFDLGSAIRQGTAADEDLDNYLEELLEGIRRDVRGVELDRLAFDVKPIPESPGEVRVVYLAQVDVPGREQPTTIPAGSLVTAKEPDGWRVLRLIPKPS